MGYVTPFKIMLFTLLSMQFAMSNGTLMCFVFKYATCYQSFVEGAAKQQCSADDTIQCLKDSAAQCDLKNSTEVNDVVQVIQDTCDPGSDLNAAFYKNKDCLFGQQLGTASVECYKKLTEAIQKMSRTGDAEKDLKALFKLTCKYSDSIKKCVTAAVKKTCGAEAESFQSKLSGPASRLEEKACNGSPATSGLFWTLLLQAAALMLSLEYFRHMK